ncbi:neuronal acetylcholine receptor subunit non-alpha-2-like [Ptychodera flava]|uniref:neuronal acetylcholine receptor subunit non-alpha-2-like n=1 Tax=Ptychodera flava TaxID=63121 RepID=UPI003969C8A6
MYGGITRTIIPYSWLWIPNVAIVRSANDRNYLSETKTVGVYYNGTVRNIPQDVLETPCILDIRYFPFDRQQCVVSFTTWNLLANEMIIRANPKNVDVSFLLKHTEWDIVGSSSSMLYIYSDIDDSNWTAVDFTLHLKRKPLYYIVNIISPSIVLAVLTLFVFFVPCDAGEKLSFSVSIVIATSLYSVIVSDIMPVTSESVPFILQLLYFNTGTVAVSIGISIFILRVHHHSENDLAMNSKLQLMFLEILPPLVGLRPFKRRVNAVSPSDKDVSRNDSHMDLVSIEDYGEDGKCGKTKKLDHDRKMSLIFDIAQNVRDIGDKFKDESKDNELLQAWKYLSVVLDRLCFFTLLIVYTVGVIALFSKI